MIVEDIYFGEVVEDFAIGDLFEWSSSGGIECFAVKTSSRSYHIIERTSMGHREDFHDDRAAKDVNMFIKTYKNDTINWIVNHGKINFEIKWINELLKDAAP